MKLSWGNADARQRPRGSSRASKVKRPMNAFLIFCKRHRANVQERNPQLDNRSVTRLLADLWANLNVSDKAEYQNIAKQDREEFLREHPGFKWYNPDKHTAPVQNGLQASPVNTFGDAVVSAGNTFLCKLPEDSSGGGLGLLLMAGQQTLAAKSQELNPFPGLNVCMNCEEIPIDLSRPTSADRMPSSCNEVIKPRETPGFIFGSNPVNPLLPTGSRLVPVGGNVGSMFPPGSSPASDLVQSRSNKCTAGHVAWPENGPSTYHLVSSIFDSLIGSAYDVQASVSSKASAKTLPMMKSPAVAAGDSIGITKSVGNGSESSNLSMMSQFPKTKKQMAVRKCSIDQADDHAASIAPVSENKFHGLPPNAQLGAMTLGELQDNLITTVVSNGSISRLLELGTEAFMCNSASTMNADQKMAPAVPMSGWSASASTCSTPAVPMSGWPASASTCSTPAVPMSGWPASASTCSTPAVPMSGWPASASTHSSGVVRSTSDKPSHLLTRPLGDKAEPGMLTHVLGLQPLLSQSHVNHLIERAITEEKSVIDLVGVGKSPSSCSVEANLVANDDGYRDVLSVNSGSYHLKPGIAVGHTPVEPMETGARQTLHEINQNKQSDIDSTQSLFILPHSDRKKTINGGSDVNGNLPNVGSLVKVEADICFGDVKGGLFTDKLSLAVDSCETNDNQISASDILPEEGISPKSGLRKSKRCNRGQRYRELVSQGVLHQARKRPDLIDGSSRCEVIDVEKTASSSKESETHHKQLCDKDVSVEDSPEDTSRLRGLNVCEMLSVLRQRSLQSDSASSAGSCKRKPKKSFILHYSIANGSAFTADEIAHDSNDCRCQQSTATASLETNRSSDGCGLVCDKQMTCAGQRRQTPTLANTNVTPAHCRDLTALADVAIATKPPLSQNSSLEVSMRL